MTEPVGSLAEEAAKLLGAAEEWWRGHAPAVTSLFAVPDEQAEHRGPECRVCPLCQGLSLVRNAQPEVFEHLVTAADAFAAAVKAAVDAYVTPRRADVPVERIDIT